MKISKWDNKTQLFWKFSRPYINLNLDECPNKHTKSPLLLKGVGGGAKRYEPFKNTYTVSVLVDTSITAGFTVESNLLHD